MWRIEGADSQTGQSRTIVVQAEDAAGAEEAARSQGLLISSVEPIAHDAQTEDASPLAAIAAARPIVNAVEYARPMDDPFPPDYRGLRFGAKFLRIAAFGAYALGGIAALQALLYCLGAGLGMVIGDFRFRTEFAGPFDSVTQALFSLWPLVAGVLLQAASEGCNALRDLARNSFR